jgi:O-acetyl-ADP-ribose deacetylase (regulator of RNase III)
VVGGRGEGELLASCYRSSLTLADEHNVRTLAFPSISTGAYQFPVERAAEIAMTQITSHLDATGSLETVRTICFNVHTRDVYMRALENARG